MDNRIFYEYKNGKFGDGITLDYYNGEYSLVSAKRGQDNKIYMQWCYPQKRGGDKGPLEKSLPWKIKLGDKEEAIKALDFFLKKLGDDTSLGDTMMQDDPQEDDVPF